MATKPRFTAPQITITAEVRRDPELVGSTDDWRTTRITAPSWCSGDPEMAVSLYLFGHRDAVTDIRNARVL